MDEERFTELVCTALKEDAERERQMERRRDTIRGFLTENPQCSADIMTPDGLVQLNAGQKKQLLDGSLKTVASGDLKIDAEGLLCQKIMDMQQDLFRPGHFQIRTRTFEQVITQSLTM